MSTFSHYDFLLRLAMIGDSGVGKSALLNRISENQFSADYISTIGVDFALKMFDVNGKKIKLQIWDTAGQERFHNITISYYRSVDAVILVYDICDEQSFLNIKRWYYEAKEYCKGDVQILLVGNKQDKSDDRQVSYNSAQNLADILELKFFETSAKTDENVTKAFNAIVAQTVENRINSQNNDNYFHKNQAQIDLDKKTKKNSSSSSCCSLI